MGRSDDVDGLELLRLHRVEVLGDILVLNRQSFQGEEWGSLWSVIASARSVVGESSNHATRDISNTITHDVSNTITKDMSNNVTHDMSNNTTHNSSNNITHNTSNNITENISHGITHNISNNITKDTPATPSTPLPPPLNERESSLLRLLADCYHCQRVGVHEEIDCGRSDGAVRRRSQATEPLAHRLLSARKGGRMGHRETERSFLFLALRASHVRQRKQHGTEENGRRSSCQSGRGRLVCCRGVSPFACRESGTSPSPLLQRQGQSMSIALRSTTTA